MVWNDPLLSFIPVYVPMLLILNASFCFDVKKKKKHVIIEYNEDNDEDYKH